MKKIILSTFALFAAVLITNAQTATTSSLPSDSKSVKVKVNVNLNSFQSIEMGSGATGGDGDYGDVVTLEYKNADDYRTGISKNVAKQLKVSSVGSGYSVKATLAKTTLTRIGADGAESIDANDILEIAIGKGFSDATPNSGKAITTTGTAFDFAGTGSSSVLDEELDVKYFGKPISQENLRTYFNNVGNKPIAYTVDVMYEIVAK